MDPKITSNKRTVRQIPGDDCQEEQDATVLPIPGIHILGQEDFEKHFGAADKSALEEISPRLTIPETVTINLCLKNQLWGEIIRKADQLDVNPLILVEQALEKAFEQTHVE
ncbi:MAG: hypothetical protein KF685_13920 [Acidobacteria bacterium]|nr:hypothetical protein [Acidobacteriota bacterium]